MNVRQLLSLVVGAATLFALWELVAHRFLMAVPMPGRHWITGAVGALLAVIVAVFSTRFVLRQQSELKRRQREMQRLARLKDDLMQMVVHDLRTPLTVMISSLDLMHKGIAGNLTPEAQQLTGIALRGSQTLLRMVNDLLDIARMEAGEPILDRDWTDVGAVAKTAACEIAPLATERRLHFATEIALEMPRLWADGDKLQRLLLNLLSNAVKFTPAGGHITLRAAWLEPERRLALAVADTGEGIPAAYHQRIFDKFGQVESRKAGHTMSSGLGLTFCKMVAEAHGGTIRVQSEPGRGSVFTVEIPGPPATGSPAMNGAPPHPKGNTP